MDRDKLINELRAKGQRILDALKAEGADKAQCTLTYSDMDETNLLGHAEYLIREFDSLDADITAYFGLRPAVLRTNRFDDSGIRACARRARIMAEAAPDAEKALLEFAGYLHPECEPTVKRDPVMLYTRFEEMCADMTREFPDVDMDGDARYSIGATLYLNTDGKELSSVYADTGFGWQAAASDRKDSTSDIGFSSGTITSWDTPFIEACTDMRKNASKLMTMLGAKPIGRGKFTGTLVFAPDYLPAFTGQLMMRVTGMKEGDGLPVPECSEGLTIFNASSDVPYTADSGILNSPNAEVEYYIQSGKPVKQLSADMNDEELAAYNAKRLERDKALPHRLFGALPGKTPYAELIKGVKQGLLIGFIQGSMPADNGDFSGAAKGSFYIENGEIKHPVVECMVSGNVFELFRNVEAISSETEFERGNRNPYVAVGGATIL